MGNALCLENRAVGELSIELGTNRSTSIWVYSRDSNYAAHFLLLAKLMTQTLSVDAEISWR